MEQLDRALRDGGMVLQHGLGGTCTALGFYSWKFGLWEKPYEEMINAGRKG